VGFSIGNKGYVGTGKKPWTNNNRKNDFWEYNPSNDQWSRKADFGGSARVSAVGFSSQGKGYITTGIDSFGNYKDDIWSYNPSTNSWQKKSDFKGSGRQRAVGFAIGKYGYIGTGGSSNKRYKDFWKYNVITDSWTQIANFNGGKRTKATAFSIGSKGYIGTGRDTNSNFFQDFWQLTVPNTASSSCTATLWEEDFDNYALNSYPSPWANLGNGNNSKVTNRDFTSSPYSCLVQGSGNCWEGSIWRSYDTSYNHYQFEVSYQFDQGSVGCHPTLGKILLVSHANSFNNRKNRSLFRFSTNQEILVGEARKNVGSFNQGQWLNLKVNYQVNANNVHMTYYVNGNLKHDTTTSKINGEDQLRFIGLTSGDVDILYDDVKVSRYTCPQDSLPGINPSPGTVSSNKEWSHVRANRKGNLQYAPSTKICTQDTLDKQLTISGSYSGNRILTGDVTGNDSLELVYAKGSDLKVYDGRGHAILSSTSLFTNGRLSLLADIDNDGDLDIGVGTRKSSSLKITFIDENGNVLKTFTKSGGYDSDLVPIALVGNQLIANNKSAYSRHPRGFSSFSISTQTENWYYDVGPRGGNVSIADIDNDGIYEMTRIGNTVNNGASGSGVNGNGTKTTDSDMWTIVADQNGNEIFSKKFTNPNGGRVNNIFADLDNDQLYRVITFEDHGSFYPGQSQIHFLDPNTGSIQSTFNGLAKGNWEYSIANMNNDSLKEIVTTNYQGGNYTHYILDTNLNVLHQSSQKGILQATADLNGNRDNEVVIRDGQTIKVLSNKLQKISQFTASNAVNNVIVSDLNSNGINEIIGITGNEIFTLENKLNKDTIQAQACNQYKVPSGSATYHKSGIFTDTLVGSNGCDSLLSIDLTINQPTSSSISPTVCDSFISPSGRYIYYNDGQYYDTLKNAKGCDSVITINLTVNSNSDTINKTVCDSYTVPSGDETYTSSGTYQDTITNAQGCDSVITFDLSISDPQVTLFLSNDTVSLNQSPIALNGGNPNGGTYSGPGVNNNTTNQSTNSESDSIILNVGSPPGGPGGGGNPDYTFDPSTAGVGTHSIVYSYTDSAGCTDSDTAIITVVSNGPVTWNGNVSKSWSNSGNWLNGGPGANEDLIIPNGKSRYPEITSNVATNKITIESNASVTITIGNQLSVNGDFTNNGNMDLGDGTLKLTGSQNQTINGNSKVASVIVDNSGNTATLNGQLHVEENMDLVSGTLNATNSSEVRLLADPNGVAYLDDFSSGHNGTYNGDIVMEQLATGSGGWRYLSSPVTNADAGEMHDDFAISAGQTGNTYYYDESNANPGFSDGWTPISSRSESMDIMQGFDVFFWQESNTNGRVSYPETFDIAGTPNTGSQSRGLTASGSQWNLLGNPYPSTLNWDNVNLPNDNSIFDGVYIWDHSSSQFETYVNGMGTNGGDAMIAPMQAFFVWANSGPTTLTLDNSARSTGTDDFVGKREENQKSKISLKVSDEKGASDEMIVYFDQAATQDFDGNYDAYEFKSTKENMPNLYSMISSNQASINGLPEVRDGLVIPVKLESDKSTTYTIDASFKNLEPGVTVYLEDKATGRLYDLQESKVKIDHKANKQDRFALRFSAANEATSQEGILKEAGFNLFSQGEKVIVDFGSSYEQPEAANVKVMTVTGKEVIESRKVVTEGRQAINLGKRSEGVYLVEVRTQTTVTTEKVFVH